MDFSKHTREIERVINTLVQECSDFCSNARVEASKKDAELAREELLKTCALLFIKENGMMDKYKEYEEMHLEECDRSEKMSENKPLSAFSSYSFEGWVEALDDIVGNVISLMAIDSGSERECAQSLYDLRELQRAFKQLAAE